MNGATVRPALSFILCSRNDNYMGNSLWRLQTSINLLAREATRLGRAHDIEILVSDWGSTEPLREAVQLTAEASALTSFVLTPPPQARALQGDSPFAEVYALNIAARRARGAYIGRIDQDTIVSRRFLRAFFDVYDGGRQLTLPLDRAYLFSARRQIPIEWVRSEPSLPRLARVLAGIGRFMPVHEAKNFWRSPVGILMMHRAIWEEVGGFDERLIYYWWMDADLATRVATKYPMVNLGAELGYEFYHLEHFPRGQGDGNIARASHRQLNPTWAAAGEGKALNPNGADWGLAKESLAVEPHQDRADALASASHRRSGKGSELSLAKILGLLAKDWAEYVRLRLSWRRVRVRVAGVLRVARERRRPTGPHRAA